MAVLGNGGKLLLKRETPEPVVVSAQSLHLLSSSFYLRNQAYWSGDQVALNCVRGLPVDSASNGPDCPDGYGMFYGTDWFLGANRSHITVASDSFYQQSNSVQFYARPEEYGQVQSGVYYIYRDQLDRISLYLTRAAALNGATSDRVPLYRVDFGDMVVSPAGTSEYRNAIAKCAGDLGDYKFSDVQDEATLASICASVPTYITPIAGTDDYDNADLTPRFLVDSGEEGSFWMLQCDLAAWTLNLRAAEVDTTSVGERYGDAVKSVVSGGGTMDFLIDRRYTNDITGDSTVLLRLLMLTEKGCKAGAQFWMMPADQAMSGVLPGGLYYQTELMVTSVAINTRPGDLIAGSLDFVTVGEIALKMGTN